MRIAFYAPFKPIDHPNPSGDLVIANGLVDHLRNRGNIIQITSRLRSRWIYWKPWNMIRLLTERLRIKKALALQKPDMWLTYHSYYKAPDLLGPAISKELNIPYVIFQGIYSTSVRRKWQTRPGYHLNTKALLCADKVLTNRHGDMVNLERLLPMERLHYLAPGIHPRQFTADSSARDRIRAQWDTGDSTVILSAAMFRADVKTEGLTWVIESCARLIQQGHNLRLVIAGDGREKQKLISIANTLLREKVIFVGQVPRHRMSEFYSGGDLFVFPGINESLGMVYLEAQSCGLPVVAFDTAGVPEVVKNGETALLTPLFDQERFDKAVASLLQDPGKRERMGTEAARYIREQHDITQNYHQLEELLQDVVLSRKKGASA